MALGRALHCGVAREPHITTLRGCPLSVSRPTPLPKLAAYLDTDPAVGKWLASVRKSPIVALDTEGASFHRFIARVYLLQLSPRAPHPTIDPLPIPETGKATG